MRVRAFTLALLATAVIGESARAQPIDGVALVKRLGAHADLSLGASNAGATGLVRLPGGARAADLGLDDVGPGLGATRGGAAGLLRFAEANPGLRIEVAPPLKLLLDRAGEVVRAPVARAAGADGAGTLVGVADTGIDVTHPDLQENGQTRIAWLLDLSLKPVGLFPELEAKFGIKDDTGQVIAGAVLDAAALDDLIKRGRKTPTDEIGHGTHVTSLAAGNGGGGRFVGVAPKAGVVFARVVRAGAETIANDDLLRGVGFMYDRAETMGRPIVVNLSVGTDFGPHDGSMAWEQQLVGFIGPGHGGRAMVVAAGNSGSVVDSPVHQSLYVTPSVRARMPFNASGGSGTLQIWVALRPGAEVRVGLDGPDGEWIPPVAYGTNGGKNASDKSWESAVVFGPRENDEVIPPGSPSAVVVVGGAPPKGTYAVTFVGKGTVDLWFQGAGAAASGSAGFRDGVREGTINLPAAHPDILAVGCTINHPSWTSIAGGRVQLQAPTLGPTGLVVPGATGRRPLEGEPCWFSSAGPNRVGVQKPEIAAPGGGVIGALAKQAKPDVPGSIFYDPSCPRPCADGNCERDARCRQIDATHGVALGTSMSSPVVAGAIALLFQRDPSLTQHEVIALLQAGAHRFTAPAAFDDQSGPGELDVPGTLAALEQSRTPSERFPSRAASWMTLSLPYAPADGASPIHAIVELRTADGHAADVFDRDRVRARAEVGGKVVDAPKIERKAPGVWTFDFVAPPGNGGRALQLSATFDGEEIVEPRTLPIATDTWSADLAPRATGGTCALEAAGTGRPSGRAWGLALALAAASAARRRRR